MDEFGVLTERFGLKPQGKSAPMAASKLSGDGNTIRSSEFGFHSAVNAKSSSYSDFEFGSFSSNTKTESYGGLDDYGDILGSFNKLPKNSVSSGGDSLFMGSSNAGASATASIFPGFDDGDMFNSVLGFKGSGSTKDDDPMGLFSSPSKPRAHGDELLGDFGRNNAKSMSQERNGWNQAAKSSGDFDELIPGFGGSSPSKGEKTEAKLPKPQTAQATNYAFTSTEDPFSVFEKSSTPAYPSSDLFSDPVEQISKFNNSADTKLGGSSNASSQFRSPSIPKPVSYEVKSSPIDELEAFAMGKVQNNSGVGKTKSTVKASKPRQATDTAGENQQKNEDYLESVFGTGSRSRSVPKSRATTLDPLFNGNLYNKKPEVPKRTSLTSSGMKKSSSVTNAVDDFSSVFGVAASLFGDFEEHEGDNEERWRARMGRRQRTEDRMAEALADMNRRNFQAKQEQEERHRIAETLDDEIKRWAAGKEGNMRALLSSLHYVLWPECGWQSVSLTDIITSASVKKVYMKANLYVHPDKVQQRGANLEQKYRAEKVFDILKEAWNKFNKDELS